MNVLMLVICLLAFRAAGLTASAASAPSPGGLSTEKGGWVPGEDTAARTTTSRETAKDRASDANAPTPRRTESNKQTNANANASAKPSCKPTSKPSPKPSAKPSQPKSASPTNKDDRGPPKSSKPTVLAAARSSTARPSTPLSTGSSGKPIKSRAPTTKAEASASGGQKSSKPISARQQMAGAARSSASPVASPKTRPPERTRAPAKVHHMQGETSPLGAYNSTRGLRIAFCLTGQLARLELASKIENIFVANARVGHLSHVFALLDHDVENVKQTYWNYDYSKSVFGAYTRRDLKAYIDDATRLAGVLKAVRTRVKLELPARQKFQIVHGVVPVREKSYSGHDGPKENFESAATRFQNNMRWMAGLRDCVRWVMDTEQQQGWHYDFVVRLRDDTYALGPWLIDGSYRGALTSSSSGNFEGINDHNFVVDRFWADTMFRGLTEDYYFNSSLEKTMWNNPENRIRTLADAYHIPVRGKNICRQPLIPLRGLINATYWYLHPLYIRHFKSDCMRLDEKGEVRPGSDAANYEDEFADHPKPTCCKREWSQKVHAKAVLAMPLPGQRILGQPGHVGVPKLVKDDVWEEGNNGRKRHLRKV